MAWFKTPQIHDGQRRRHIILRASLQMLKTAFWIGLALTIILGASSVMQNDQAVRHTLNLGVMVIPAVFVVVLPLLLIIWPLAALALRNGFAGRGIALASGAVAGGALIVFITGGAVSMQLFITATFLGMICSHAYWNGARRSDPDAFDPRLRDSR